MTRGLVSVVIPVYNGEQYIAEAIESVLRQTYSDWVLTVVDNAEHGRHGGHCRRVLP